MFLHIAELDLLLEGLCSRPAEGSSVLNRRCCLSDRFHRMSKELGAAFHLNSCCCCCCCCTTRGRAGGRPTVLERSIRPFTLTFVVLRLLCETAPALCVIYVQLTPATSDHSKSQIETMKQLTGSIKTTFTGAVRPCGDSKRRRMAAGGGGNCGC